MGDTAEAPDQNLDHRKDKHGDTKDTDDLEGSRPVLHVGIILGILAG
jgi:hypothetical protein